MSVASCVANFGNLGKGRESQQSGTDHRDHRHRVADTHTGSHRPESAPEKIREDVQRSRAEQSRAEQSRLQLGGRPTQ